MGESVAFPYLARLILRTASGCDVVAVKFSGACPGFPNFKTSPTKFFLEFSQVNPDFKLWDPENSSPTPRTYTFGINVTM